MDLFQTFEILYVLSCSFTIFHDVVEQQPQAWKFLRTKAGTDRAGNEAPGGNRKAASGFTAVEMIPAQQRFQWKLIGT